ncbi:MAG: hypothetical protein NXI31_00445 [bacterium]|nr:hypothetical protein [bacterium]
MFDPGRSAQHPLMWWGVLLVGAILRVAALDVESLWLDEGFSVHVATAPDFWAQLELGSSPPWFLLVLRGWSELVGLDAAWLRMLPALASVGALGLLAVALRCSRLPGASAMLVLALYAGSPFLCWYAHELRAYSFLELGTVAMFLGWRFAVAGRARAGLALVALGAAWACWSHYFGTFAVLAFVAIAWLLPPAGARRWSLPVAALLGLATALPAYWLLLPAQMQQAWGAQSQLSFAYVASLPLRLFVAHGGQLPQWLVLANAGALFALIVLVLGQIWRGRTRAWPIVALLGAVLPIAAAAASTLIVEPRFTARYFIMVPLYLSLGVGLAVADWPARRGHAVALGMFLLLLLTNGFSWRLGINDGYREACASVREHWQAGDRIGLVTGMPAGFGSGPLRSYLPPAIVAAGFDRDHEVGPGRARNPRQPSGRLHLVMRWAPYTAAHIERLLAALPIAQRGERHNRVQHVVVEWR